MDLAETQNKLNEIMAENELVPKLALIEIMEGEVEQLIDEVEQLKKQKERRRLWSSKKKSKRLSEKGKQNILNKNDRNVFFWLMHRDLN